MRPRSERVVFVGGAPGSGKSTAAAEASARIPDLLVVTAGELIRRGLGREGGYARPPVAGAEEAQFFQDVLVAEFAAIRVAHPGPVVLDGHYAVPTAEGPVVLPSDVFRRLGCTDLVLVEAEVDVLAARLRERDGADWWDGTDTTLVRLVDADRAAAVQAARALGLRLLTVEGVGGAVAAVSTVLASP